MVAPGTSTETIEKVVLKVEVEGGVRLDAIREFLADLEMAYISLVVFNPCQACSRYS